MATSSGAETVAGAVYTPLLEIVPRVEFPPATLFTCQFTAVFDSLATGAENVWVLPVYTSVAAGLVVTLTIGALATARVTCADCEVKPLAFEIAVTVIGCDPGEVAGAA